MGKPIKIIDVINNLIKLKKKLNKNYNFKLKEVGLKKGEKMNEELSISNKLKITNIRDIKITHDPIYNKDKIFDLIKNLQKNISVYKKINIIKLFLGKELRL